MKYPDDFDPVRERSVKSQVLREAFNWKHPHSHKGGTPVTSGASHFRLTRKQPERLTGGTIKLQRQIETPMFRQVRGLLIKVAVGKGTDGNATLHLTPLIVPTCRGGACSFVPNRLG